MSGKSNFALLLGCFTAVWMLAALPVAAEEGGSKPNFVFVLIDDLGWRDVGFMGNTFVETPHLDRLAARGIVFTQAYASAPNCAPSRACLLSGQYTPRHGIYTVVDPRQPRGSPWHKLLAAESKSELAPEVVTIAESLQTTGYKTAFFGMWNVGRGRSGPVTPSGQGFDRVVFPESLGFAKDEYFDGRKNYLSDRLTDKVLDFIEKSRGSPFFVYLADHAVHAPFNPKPELLAKYEKKTRASQAAGRDDAAYAATIEAVDQNLGRLVETLERLKLMESTYIIFTSDNGGTDQYTVPLRGGKRELYEGGIRAPLFISGPDVQKPGNKCAAAVATIDFYPTLLELAGAAAPKSQTLDGASLVPLLGGAETLSRERLFWHFPCYVGKAAPSSAVREGDFKLIEFFENRGRPKLFDLRNDPHEQHDLSQSMPDQAAALYRTLQEWQQETRAALPLDANPTYDANASRPKRGR